MDKDQTKPEPQPTPPAIESTSRVNQSSESQISQWLQRAKTFIHNHYNAVLLAGVAFLLIEMLWGVSVLRSARDQATVNRINKLTSSPKPTPYVPLSDSTFSMTASPSAVSVGQQVTITLKLDTDNKKTDGATAKISYDPAKLTFVRVKNGSLYSDYLPTKHDATKGQVTVTAITDLTSYYTGQGTFAEVVFTAKAKGSTKVDYLYTLGKSDESALAAGGKQILNHITGTTITIQ